MVKNLKIDDALVGRLVNVLIIKYNF